MTDRDSGDKDDLFEDLDKFFAPIQDVEWPEPEAPPAGPAEPAHEHVEVQPQREGSAVDTDETVEVPRQGVDDVQVVETAEADIDDRGGGEATVFEGVVVRQATPRSEPEDRGGLFEEQPQEIDDWPTETAEMDLGDDWPSEGAEAVETVEVVAPPAAETGIESPPAAAPSDEPTEEAVEAAAEHFASSLRAGTDVEPPGEGTPVEPAEPKRAEPEPAPAEPAGEAQPSPDEFVTTIDMSFAAEDADVEESILADLEEPSSEPRTIKVGGEGMVGPSWEEPTSVEIGSDVDTGGADTGRDVPAAFLTGVVLVALGLGALAIGNGVFAVVAGAVILLAQGELYFVIMKRHLHPATALGLVAGALVTGAAYFHGEPAMAAMLVLGTIATFIWYMAVPASQRRHVTASVGLTMLPVLYVAGMGGYALVTLALPEALDGRALLIAVIGLTFAYDTAAFAVGSVWGNRPLAQSVSPKKSIEGAVGATLVVIIVAIGLVPILVEPLDSIAKALGLAIIVSIFAPVGDLAESLMKRDLGVKDMGSLLPGHGGVLDRIDSLLFVLPAAFLYFRIFL